MKVGEEKLSEEIMAQTFSKFDKNYKLIDLRNSVNLKHTPKNEENYMKTHHNQISQN